MTRAPEPRADAPCRGKRPRWDGLTVAALLAWELAERAGTLRGCVDADANRRAFLAFAARRGVSASVSDAAAWRSLRLALRDRMKACPAFRACLAFALDALKPERRKRSRERRRARSRRNAAWLDSPERRNAYEERRRKRRRARRGSAFSPAVPHTKKRLGRLATPKRCKEVDAACVPLFKWTPEEIAWAKRHGTTPEEIAGGNRRYLDLSLVKQTPGA